MFLRLISLTLISLALSISTNAAVVLGDGYLDGDDFDADGVANEVDSSLLPDGSQADFDGDGIGDPSDKNPNTFRLFPVSVTLIAPVTLDINVGDDLVFSLNTSAIPEGSGLVQFDLDSTVSGIEAHDNVARAFSAAENFAIASDLYTNGTEWDLNSVGTYSFDVHISGIEFTAAVQTINVNVTAVPEPSSTLFLSLGGLLLIMRKKR